MSSLWLTASNCTFSCFLSFGWDGSEVTVFELSYGLKSNNFQLLAVPVQVWQIVVFSELVL